MLNWIVWNRIELIIYIKMDLVLNNLQRLICHKTQTTNQHKESIYSFIFLHFLFLKPLNIRLKFVLTEDLSYSWPEKCNWFESPFFIVVS